MDTYQRLPCTLQNKASLVLAHRCLREQHKCHDTRVQFFHPALLAKPVLYKLSIDDVYFLYYSCRVVSCSTIDPPPKWKENFLRTFEFKLFILLGSHSLLLQCVRFLENTVLYLKTLDITSIAFNLHFATQSGHYWLSGNTKFWLLLQLSTSVIAYRLTVAHLATFWYYMSPQQSSFYFRYGENLKQCTATVHPLLGPAQKLFATAFFTCVTAWCSFARKYTIHFPSHIRRLLFFQYIINIVKYHCCESVDNCDKKIQLGTSTRNSLTSQWSFHITKNTLW